MTRGELAIRASQTTARAAARESKSLNEAVSNRMDEGVARAEAESMIKPPEKLAKVAGEAADLDDLGFITGWLVDTLDNPTSISVDASDRRMHLAAGAGVLPSAVDAALSAQAGSSLEKMLCHQLAAAHSAAMKLAGRVGGGSVPIVEESRLANAAARMMQVFQEGLLTLQRLKTGGKQTMIVQHVQVSQGGQAVIAGSVKSKTEGGNIQRLGSGDR